MAIGDPPSNPYKDPYKVYNGIIAPAQRYAVPDRIFQANGATGTASQPNGGLSNEPYSRRQSFTERYVIARASTFEVGKEKEQAWQATLDAESIYAMIQQREPRK